MVDDNKEYWINEWDCIRACYHQLPSGNIMMEIYKRITHSEFYPDYTDYTDYRLLGEFMNREVFIKPTHVLPPPSGFIYRRLDSMINLLNSLVDKYNDETDTNYLQLSDAQKVRDILIRHFNYSESSTGFIEVTAGSDVALDLSILWEDVQN